MARGTKWVHLVDPKQKTYYQPDQLEFLKARRLRFCPRCGIPDKPYVFSVEPTNPSPDCPVCGSTGIRVYDRLSVIAGRRFGKTRFGSIAALEEALIPNSVVWCCAPTNPKLHRYVIPAMQLLIPEDFVDTERGDWNSEHKDLYLKNGSLIHFQTLEDPDQGRGQGLTALWIDEVCELTEKHWDVIRPSLGDRAGVAYFTSSPRSFDWVYDKLYMPGVKGDQGYWALHAKTSQNPLFQDARGKAFLEREKANMSPEMYAQEYEGDFVTFTGAVYKSFDHLTLNTEEQLREFIPSYPDLSGYQVIVGLDTGADHPFGAVKLVATEKGLVVLGEYLERDRSFIEHAAELHRLASSSLVTWACNKNERQGMIELAQHGIYPKAAQNDQMAGIERVRSWIHQRKLFFYAPAVPTVIRQMKAHRFAENVSTDGQARKEQLYKKDDELPDCLRYALMVWPRLKAAVPGSKQRDLSHFDAETRSTIEFIRRHDAAPKEPESPQDWEQFWAG
ncbi:MAG: terminase family protein [Actinobacteria bacterium]|nr:terminase family protein [Actinomycetota bacterium]